MLFLQAAEGSPNATVLLSALGDDQRRPCAVMMYFLDNGMYKFTYGNMKAFLKNVVIWDETY